MVPAEVREARGQGRCAHLQGAGLYHQDLRRKGQTQSCASAAAPRNTLLRAVKSPEESRLFRCTKS